MDIGLSYHKIQEFIKCVGDQHLMVYESNTTQSMLFSLFDS